MITEIDKAWLAGFWDGEGSITIFTHTEKNGRKKICPTINVTNTNEYVIAHVVELLDKLGTSFSILEKKSDNDKWKTAYTVGTCPVVGVYRDWETDRKSTRLNSSHRL